jgi:hypothetical protein
MFRVITQYKAQGIKGGYVLQYVGNNKPSWIVGKNSTFSWYKFRSDALKACEVQNNALRRK